MQLSAFDSAFSSRVIAHFVPNFVAMATLFCLGKMQLAAFYVASPKTRHKRKYLAKIFYASRFIVYFVSNFVAMATRVGRKKCNWQHWIAHF